MLHYASHRTKTVQQLQLVLKCLLICSLVCSLYLQVHQSLLSTGSVRSGQCVQRGWAVGTHEKVRLCPPIVGVFVSLMSAVEGEDGPG